MRRGVALLLLLAAAASCRGCPRRVRAPEPPADAQEAALGLFRLARVRALSDADLSRVVDPERLARDPSSCRDALAPLALASSPAATAVEVLPGSGRTAVDVEAALPGGGTARYSIQAAPRPDGTWRVVWFEGPGARWPVAAPAKGEGLTTSAPP